MKKLLLAAMIAFTFASCSQDDERPSDCNCYTLDHIENPNVPNQESFYYTNDCDGSEIGTNQYYGEHYNFETLSPCE